MEGLGLGGTQTPEPDDFLTSRRLRLLKETMGRRQGDN